LGISSAGQHAVRLDREFRLSAWQSISDKTCEVVCLKLKLLCLQNGKFIPEKSNIWRDCVDGYYDWVKEHIMEVNDLLNLQRRDASFLCNENTQCTILLNHV
jgi:hypothetical protein